MNSWLECLVPSHGRIWELFSQRNLRNPPLRREDCCNWESMRVCKKLWKRGTFSPRLRYFDLLIIYFLFQCEIGSTSHVRAHPDSQFDFAQSLMQSFAGSSMQSNRGRDSSPSSFSQLESETNDESIINYNSPFHCDTFHIPFVPFSPEVFQFCETYE